MVIAAALAPSSSVPKTAVGGGKSAAEEIWEIPSPPSLTPATAPALVPALPPPFRSRGAYAERLAAATALAVSVTSALAPAAAAAAAAAAAEAAAGPRAIASLRRPKVVLLPSTTRQSTRGSLSEQLDAATRAAVEVSVAFRKRAATPSVSGAGGGDAGGDVLIIPGVSFRVGRITSHQGAPVTLSASALRYFFRGCGQNVDMTMRFGDIRDSAAVTGVELTFRVLNEMPAFGEDYVPANAAHYVGISFPTKSAAQTALAHIKGGKSGRR